MNKFIVLLLSLTLSQLSVAQGYGFGFKVGPSLGIQKWTGFGSNDPLFAYHADVFVDQFGEEEKLALYGQLGYHQRGSSLRYVSFSGTNNIHYDLIFHNAVLELGMKKLSTLGKGKWYYSLGLRGEYTFDTKLEVFEGMKDFVEKWNYGASVRGGAEFPLAKLINGFLEITIAPDFSKQLFLPGGLPYTDPFSGQRVQTAEQNVRNTSLELSFGMRFINKIIYID